MDRRRRVLRKARCVAFGLCTAALVGCGTASTPTAHDATSIEAGARGYAEAILHGTAREVNDSISSTCRNPATDAGLAALRDSTSASRGLSFDALHIVSIETRNVTATDGEAWVHLDLSPELEGNDNWLTYAVEGGLWKLTDCGQLPFGRSGSSGPVTVSGATGRPGATN